MSRNRGTRLLASVFGPSRPGTPRWNRKRWALPALSLIAAAYVSGAGPVAYAVGRGWLTVGTYEACYAPLGLLFDPRDGLLSGMLPYDDFVEWCHEVGRRHRGSL